MINRDKERREEARRRLFRRRLRIIPRLRAYFFAGVLVTMPLAVTFLVAWWFIGVVDDYVVPWIPEGWNPDHYLKETVGLEIGLPGLGLVVLLVVIVVSDNSCVPYEMIGTSIGRSARGNQGRSNQMDQWKGGGPLGLRRK